MSTGVRGSSPADRKKASAKGAEIYAQEIAKPPRAVVTKTARRGGVKELERLIALWLHSLESTHAPSTRETWEGYGGYFLEFFADASGLTEARCAEYIADRLKSVIAETVKKEKTALQSFLTWCETEKHLPPIKVPKLPKRAKGTPHKQRRRVAAIPLSPEQVESVIAALPEWGGRGATAAKPVERFPVKARFEVAYETSLRPSTLDRICTPTHYRKGESMLRLTADVDKARYARDVPLSSRARAALDRVLDALDAIARSETGDPEAKHEGLIFGEHDYRLHIEKAATAALPPELATRFCGAHLRSAQITHLLERPTATLPGVQYLAGHKLVSTTAKYVRPSFRAAEAVLSETKNEPVK